MPTDPSGIGPKRTDFKDPEKLREKTRTLDETLRYEMERLQMLLDVVMLLSSNWDISEVFPRISARIRRVLRQEYASFELHDANTGTLVRQAMDFPLGKGFTAAVQVSASESTFARVLKEQVPRTFSKDEIQRFEGEVSRNFVAEGIQSLCCIPLVRPKGPLGVFMLGSTRKSAFQPEE